MTVRIGLIGIGGLGYLLANTYAEMDGVAVVAAADVSADARSLFESEFDAPAYEVYGAMLAEHGDNLDGVTIVTPHTHHYEQAMASLDRGCHVLVEKPMVTDVAHGLDLVRRAHDRNLVLQVGFQRHFHPGFKEVRRVLASGRVGEVHTVSCYLGQDWIDNQRETWRTVPALSGGGQLYDSGSHLLDVLLWTTHSIPHEVTAQMTYAEPEVDVNASLTARLGRDDPSVLASVAISGDGTDMVPSEGYTFFGTEGRLTYADGHVTVAEKGAATYSTEVEGGQDFQTLNRRKLENFVESIEGTAEPAVPGEYGLEVTVFAEAAYRAAETGSTVQARSLLGAEGVDGG